MVTGYYINEYESIIFGGIVKICYSKPLESKGSKTFLSYVSLSYLRDTSEGMDGPGHAKKTDQQGPNVGNII